MIRTGGFPGFHQLYRCLYFAQAKILARRLLRIPDVHDVYLRGSVVRPDFYPGISDIDFTIELTRSTPEVLVAIHQVFNRSHRRIYCNFNTFPISNRLRKVQFGNLHSKFYSFRQRQFAEIGPLPESFLKLKRIAYIGTLYRKLYQFAKTGPVDFRLKDVLSIRLLRIDRLLKESVGSSFDPAPSNFGRHGEGFYQWLESVEPQLQEHLDASQAPLGTKIQMHPSVLFQVSSLQSVRSAPFSNEFQVPPGLGRLLSVLDAAKLASLEFPARDALVLWYMLFCGQRFRRYTVSRNPKDVLRLLEYWALIGSSVPTFDASNARILIDALREFPGNSTEWLFQNFSRIESVFEQPFLVESDSW